MEQKERLRRTDNAMGMLSLPTKDAWGHMFVEGISTIPGVYDYRQADGSIRKELKHPDEVYSAKHIESVRNAVVTDEHLPGGVAVTPLNARDHGRGHATEARRTGGGLFTKMKITDSRLIEKLERKEKRGISLGLDMVWDPTPGVWNGQSYHGVQRDMITNQVTVTETPRVENAEIRLDSDDAIMVEGPPEPEEEKMTQMKIKIGDSEVEVEPGAGSVIQARLSALDSQLHESGELLASLTKERDTLQGHLDTAKEQLEKSKGFTVDAADIPELFKARQSLLEGAKLIMDSDDFEKLDTAVDTDVRRAACKSNGLDVTDQNDDYVLGRFEALVSLKRVDSTKTRTLAEKLTNVASGGAVPEATAAVDRMTKIREAGRTRHLQVRGA